MKPTKEQLQWFWEQCKVQHNWTAVQNNHGHWTEQCSNCHLYKGYVQQCVPFVDPNNLFKYAVPNKAIKTVCLCDHFDYSEGIPERSGYEATVMWDRMDNTTQGIDKDPALAIFWAIYKALGGKDGESTTV